MPNLIYTHGALAIEIKVPWQDGSGIIPPPKIGFIFPCGEEGKAGEEVWFVYSEKRVGRKVYASGK